MPNILERINSKILLKITLLVIIEIILIVRSSFLLTGQETKNCQNCDIKSLPVMNVDGNFVHNGHRFKVIDNGVIVPTANNEFLQHMLHLGNGRESGGGGSLRPTADLFKEETKVYGRCYVT